MYRFQVSPTLGALGTTVPSTCPQCSKLVDGSCEVCDDTDADDKVHPSCQYCTAGKYAPPADPWYKNPIITSIGGAVCAAVLTAIVLKSLKHNS
jgi:hypothetical protein